MIQGMGRSIAAKIMHKRLLVSLGLISAGLTLPVASNLVSIPPAGASPKEIPPGGCVCSGSTITVTGPDSVSGTLEIDNLSSFPTSRVQLLVKYADVGTTTTSPSIGGSIHGLMNPTAPGRPGDTVVVTNYGMYWMDLVVRGGGLGGMWPLAIDTSGNANFTNLVNGWAPNLLLPGSNGDSNNTTAGFRVFVQGTGGADGSQPPGKGTFTLQYAHASESARAGGTDHLYTFTGTMVQEYDTSNNQIVDNQNYAGQMLYNVTYDFHDANDAATDENGTLQAFRFRTTVQLTEHNLYYPSQPNLQIQYISVGEDFQSGNPPAGVPIRYWELASEATNHTGSMTYPCSQPATVAANAWGALCVGPSYSLNLFYEPISPPNTLDAGGKIDSVDYCTAYSTVCVSYIHPYVTGVTQPYHDTIIWSGALGVTGTDVSYLDTSNPYETWANGSSQTYELDQELSQY